MTPHMFFSQFAHNAADLSLQIGNKSAMQPLHKLVFLHFQPRELIFEHPFPLLLLSPLSTSQAIMAFTVTIVFGGLLATYLFLRFLLHVTQDAREPPTILTGIPFFSPVIGMIREKSRFYLRLRFVGSV